MQESQRLVNVIRQAIDQKIGEQEQHTPGVIISGGGSYLASAYIRVDDVIEDIIIPSGMYVSAGDYVVISMNQEGKSYISRQVPRNLYSRMVIDYDRAMISAGDGTTEVAGTSDSWGTGYYDGEDGVKLVADVGDDGLLHLRNAVSNNNTGAQIFLYQSRGTLSSPYTSSDGDYNGISSAFFDGVEFNDGGGIYFVLDGTASANNTPSAIEFFVNLGGEWSELVWRLNSDGHIVPALSNTYDIGSASSYIRHVYAADLPSRGFFNVTEPRFGAMGDGTADDTVAIQAAISSAYAAGAGTVFFPPGVYKITDTIEVNHSGIRLIGSGRDRWHNGTVPWDSFVNTAETTSILWAGSAYGTMLQFEPGDGNPTGISGTAAMYLNLIGGIYPHTTVAGTGISIKAVASSEFDIMGQEFTNAVMEMGGKTSMSSEASSVFNHVYALHGRQIDNTGAILKFTGNAVCDAFNNLFDLVEGVYKNGHGIDFSESDSNHFRFVRLQRADSGTGTGILIRATNTFAPQAHKFEWVYPGEGGVVLQGEETATLAARDIKIANLDLWEDGTPNLPTVGTNANLYYGWDLLPEQDGFLPFAYPAGSHGLLSSGTTLTLAAVSASLGGAIAVPFLLPARMMVGRLAIYQTATANLRTAEWNVYSDQRGNTNLFRRIVKGSNFSFTPGAAGVQFGGVTGGPDGSSIFGGMYLVGPGVVWVVVRNTSTAQTFDIGAAGGGSLGRAHIRTNLTASNAALGVTQNISTWSGNGVIPIMRLEGLIGDEAGPW